VENKTIVFSLPRDYGSKAFSKTGFSCAKDHGTEVIWKPNFLVQKTKVQYLPKADFFLLEENGLEITQKQAFEKFSGSKKPTGIISTII
jgi:hypothetical protein